MNEVKRYNVISDKYGDGTVEESESGSVVFYEDYAELKAQCDALAAENSVLKTAAKSAVQHWAAADQESMVRLMDKVMPACRDAVNATPATDSYLNSVRAEGVEILTGKLQQLIDEGVFDAKEIGVAAGAIHEGAQMAAQLRAGEKP